MEEWRDVAGYENYFQISDLGRLRSKRTNKILSQTISKTGYYTHATKIGGRKGKSICFKIHRLVCKAFHPNPENKKSVNHKDGNKLNNHKDNVEWATQHENMTHAVSTGLLVNPKGEENNKAKLSEKDVIQIRMEYETTKISQRALAKKYEVSRWTIQDIVTYTTWKHINNGV